MANAYTIPEMEGNKNFANNDRDNLDENELQSFDDLPKFLRHALYLSPTHWKKTWLVLQILGQFGFGLPIMGFITKSLAPAIALSTYGVIANCAQILQPDFTKKGVFLNLLLRDSKITKTMSDNTFKGGVGGFIFFLCVAPLFWFFFIIPFALYTVPIDKAYSGTHDQNTTQIQSVENIGLLGPSTFEITIICGIVGTIANLSSFILSATVTLPSQISLVHINKIKNYLEAVRDIILNDNEEDGIPLVDKLSNEQKKVEKWIFEINKGISLSNTLDISVYFLFMVMFLIIIGSGVGIGATITFSLFSILIFSFLTSSLYAIAKPNMVWEQQKVSLLNDPKVISCVLLKLKFPKENFESWLHLHNINASRAFGTKITFEKMKQAAGILTSGFGVALYLLLRQDLTSKGIL